MTYNVRPWVRSSLLFFLIAFLLIGLTAFATTFAQKRAAKARAPDVVELFRNNCARCHGADGRAQTPSGELYKVPDLTDENWWREHSDITATHNLIGIVTRGKGAMPAFGKKLKRSDISRLVSYARRFRPRK
jgi:mono/diheme cytochrome c family protein